MNTRSEIEVKVLIDIRMDMVTKAAAICDLARNSDRPLTLDETQTINTYLLVSELLSAAIDKEEPNP